MFIFPVRREVEGRRLGSKAGAEQKVKFYSKKKNT
jgi:hypothetical protein